MTWQAANPTKAKACGHWSAMSRPRNVKRMIVPTISDSGVAQLSNLSNQCIFPTHISSLWNSCNVRRLRCTCFILFHFVLEFLPFQTSDAFVVAWWLVSGILEDPTGRSKEDLFGSGKHIKSVDRTDADNIKSTPSIPSVDATGEITWYALIVFLQWTFGTLFGFHVLGLYQARTKILERFRDYRLQSRTIRYCNTRFCPKFDSICCDLQDVEQALQTLKKGAERDSCFWVSITGRRMVCRGLKWTKQA